MSIRPPRQRGYSLAELLVVVAIIGAISLVTIPNFISLMRSNKFKNSLHQLTNDFRLARQRAITRYTPVKIGFKANERAYAVYDFAGTTGGITQWTRVGNVKYLDENTYFATPTTFTDRADDADDMIDVIFTNTGALDLPAGATSPYQVVLRTNDRIPKDQYTVEFRLAGSLNAVGSSWR